MSRGSRDRGPGGQSQGWVPSRPLAPEGKINDRITGGGCPGDLAGALEGPALSLKDPDRPPRASLPWATKVWASRGGGGTPLPTCPRQPRTWPRSFGTSVPSSYHGCAGRCSGCFPNGGGRDPAPSAACVALGQSGHATPAPRGGRHWLPPPPPQLRSSFPEQGGPGPGAGERGEGPRGRQEEWIAPHRTRVPPGLPTP